jgi:ABC-type phosphate/phosphonate transport system substrate-binding protein
VDPAVISRRGALASLFGGWTLLRAAPAADAVRMAFSESLVADVNINDARAAMTTWLKQMAKDLKYDIEYSPKVFETTEEIVSRTRGGRVDAVALNILEYRQIADCLDPSQVVTETSGSGLDQYVLLAKRESGPPQLGHLRGRRLCMLKSPKMCVAPAWISNVLEAAHLGPTERFFNPVTTETKIQRVVLPVFFGQADACITTSESFAMMCEMNPQVGVALQVVAISAPLVVKFHVFHKNFNGASRREFTRVITEFRNNASARQLATLFQFDQLTIRDAHCLDSALAELEMADRTRAKRS